MFACFMLIESCRFIQMLISWIDHPTLWNQKAIKFYILNAGEYNLLSTSETRVHIDLEIPKTTNFKD